MFSLQDFVAGCERLVDHPDGAKQVLELMRVAVRDREMMREVVTPGGSGQAILDVPVFRTPNLLILNVTLYPRFMSPPHDHRMWAVIGLYEGRENNTFYRRAGERLEEVERRPLHAGEAVLLGPEVIHAIENPLASRTRALHVYGGDLSAVQRSMWDPYSGEERPYDPTRFFAWCAELTMARSAG